MAASTIYCIDTSSIFKWYIEVYPPTIFAGLQQNIEKLIEEGRLRSPKAVLDEIKPGDDCHKWAKAQPKLFMDETGPVQTIVRHLMATHHDPQKPHKGINGADPFVIAMAMDGGVDWRVVADEHPGSLENRKIPFVCNQEGVSHTTFQGLMLAEAWKF